MVLRRADVSCFAANWQDKAANLRAIASQLKLSVKTIDSYREHLKVKLGLKSGADLVRYAIQWMKSQAIL